MGKYNISSIAYDFPVGVGGLKEYQGQTFSLQLQNQSLCEKSHFQSHELRRIASVSLSSQDLLSTGIF